jgi:hypothetical protein
VVDNIRRTACPPTGDNNHSNIRHKPIRLKRHNLICVIIVPPTVRLPINRSSSPTVEPRSTFHDANLTIALPTTTEKTRGNNVAAFAKSANIKWQGGFGTHAFYALIQDVFLVFFDWLAI